MVIWRVEALLVVMPSICRQKAMRTPNSFLFFYEFEKVKICKPSKECY